MAIHFTISLILARQLLYYCLCKVFVYLFMARNRLGLFRGSIRIPIMLSAVSRQNASHFFKVLYQITAFH